MFLDDFSGIALWARGHVLPPWDDAVVPVPTDLRVAIEAWIADGESLMASARGPSEEHIEHDLAGAHLAMRLQAAVGDPFLIVYEFETDEAYERYDADSASS
jgi:hypothetical protein